MLKKYWFVSQLLFLILLFGGRTLAVAGPSVSLTVSENEINPGSNITYNILVSNSSAEDYSNVELGMDLNVGSGLSFLSSSYSVEWENNNPFWRLGDIPAGGERMVSLTVNVGSNYVNDSISTQANMSANSTGGLVSSSSAYTTVVIVPDSESTDKDDTNQQKDDENTDTTKTDDTKKTETTDEQKPDDLTANGVSKIDVKEVAGLADMSSFENVNRWDKRFLVVGVVAFILILVVGLSAFMLGRKSS